MSDFLYPNFLEQEDQYAAAEQFWHGLFTELTAEARQTGEWVPWRPRSYVNGLPFERDGNPIFDALNKRTSKAIQVIQWPPKRDALEISAWVSHLYVEDDDDLNNLISELTLNLTLSTESVELSKQLLRKWLDENVDGDEMSRLINQQLPG